MRIIKVLIVSAIWLAASNVYGGEPIIDMHLHARINMLRDSAGEPLPRPCLPVPCIQHPPMASADEDVRRMTLEAMERNNIVLGFLSDPLEWVYEWADAAPDTDIFILSPAVFTPTDVSPDDLELDYQNGRLRGVGELATQYAGFAPNDQALEPFFQLASDHDVPVLIHTEGIAGPSPDFRIQDGHPELLQGVLEKHPGLRLYLENAGYPFLDEVKALMYRYPNVYADLSTITWIIPRSEFYSYLDGLIQAGLEKRLMFGSDQMYWPETIDLAIDAIRSAPFLTEDQKRDILYNNAARFLRLDEKTIADHKESTE